MCTWCARKFPALFFAGNFPALILPELQKHIWKMQEIFQHFQNVGNISTFLKCRNSSAFWQLQKYIWKMLEIFLHFQNVGNMSTFFKCRNNSNFWKLQKHIWKMQETFLHFKIVGNISAFIKCRNNSAFDNYRNTFEKSRKYSCVSSM